ncbi:SDR family oxidoreductase [Tardiphaga sp. 1201_B9_N1_2]|uniref:SDR family oxidoreductase n=1 Tax=Tardiphaga sp. 1201_B9_N1_2 TaxID=3240378 RepID=UPI003F24491B
MIGASGIVGGYIVEQLVRSGQRPQALSRQPRQSAGVDWLQGDLAVPAALQVPAVKTLYCTVEIGLLAKALPQIATPSLKRVVAFTSTSIVTKINSEIPSERELLQRLADGECRLGAVCEKLGIEWTILRPTVIYAEGRDGNVSRLARLIKRFGFLPLMGSGAGLRQPVHAEDLAIGAIAAAGSSAAMNRIYAVPGGEILSYREMVGRIFDALGKARRIVSVPPLLWKIAFTLAKPLLPHTNVAMGNRMAKDMTFDASAAIRDFRWRPRGFQPRFDGKL